LEDKWTSESPLINPETICKLNFQEINNKRGG